MTTLPPTVFVVDDDPSVLKALTRLLRTDGLETRPFASPKAFLEQHDCAMPGCVVLDVAMPGLNGLELQQALVKLGSPRPIVFLSGRGDVPTSVLAMKAGAVDFLTKPVNGRNLLAAVRKANEMDRQVRQTQSELRAVTQRLATLTPRELEVLQHVIAGQLNKQIAADLGIVEKTIKVHRARVMEKMGIRSVAELVRLADQAGVSCSKSPASG